MAKNPWKHPKLAKAIKDNLAQCELLWKELRDPLSALSAWSICRECELEPPEWLLAYFDECTENIFKEWKTLHDRPNNLRPPGWKRAGPRERDAAVARAFGFKQRGRES